MRVAHMVVITPNRCGLYETTREIVRALRGLGVDSRLVDPLPDDNPVGFKGNEDRGAIVANLAWAETADIIVSHSGVASLFEDKQPIIQIVHGRPRDSYLKQKAGLNAVYSHHYIVNKQAKYKAIVTMWPEHKPYMDMMYSNIPVHLIQSCVDLEFYKPNEVSYDFDGQSGGVNIVIADADRHDVDSFNCLHAYGLWARENSHLNPKLHFLNKPENMKGVTPIIKTIQNAGHMGMIGGWVKGLQNIYNAADLTITDHEIDVRTVRESMACGCPVVKMTKVRPDWIKQGLLQSRKVVRATAEHKFNPINSAKELKEIIEKWHK